MNKKIKIILGIIFTIILCFTIDIICIFTINRPIFAIRIDNNESLSKVYKGILYDTYNCLEYTVPQIKLKGTKFSCSMPITNIGKVIEITDTTKNIKDFDCAEALEEFYEDEDYIYYYNCVKSKYMIVKYETGYKETVSNALKNGTIKISDLDKYGINYIKYDKNKQ